MNKEIQQIRLPIVNDYIKIIRRLAKSGRNDYHEYLIHPLTDWSKKIPSDDLGMLLKKIRQKSLKKDYAVIAGLYKKALLVSVAPYQFDLSQPGNIALDFLKEMQNKVDVAHSPEALEFVNLLQKPFKIYQENEFKLTNEQFIEEINTADSEEVKDLIKTRQQGDTPQINEQELSDSLIKKIQEELNQHDIVQVKKNVLSYLLRVSSSNNPELHKDIDPLLDRIETFHPGFKKDIMGTSAVLIYHEIVNAIKTKQLKKAITFITKYTVLFRGDPSTPNHYEVDSFEKQFFDLVEKRNLWDSL